MGALSKNDTWILVPPSAKYDLIGNKWVFRVKRHPDGTVHKYKVRLVAKGFHQQPGIDFHETFSHVIKAPTIRLILALVASKQWDIRQLDINNVFLNGHLQETMFMKQP